MKGTTRQVLGALNRYSGLLAAVAALIALFFAWQSARDGRDAARAAKEQVLLQAIPYLDPSPGRLAHYRVTLGDYRIPAAYRGAFDAVERTKIPFAQHGVVLALALRNVGDGYAVIHFWRVVAPFPYRTAAHLGDPPGTATRTQIVRPTETAILTDVPATPTPKAGSLPLGLVGAVRAGTLAFQVFFSDLSDERKYVITFTVSRTREGEWKTTDTAFTLGWRP